MNDENLPRSQAEHRHVTVVRLQAPSDGPGFTAHFEPEGGERLLQPGDHLTITFDTDERQEIDLEVRNDGLVFWRPTRGDVKVAIIDSRTGEEITDLW